LFSALSNGLRVHVNRGLSLALTIQCGNMLLILGLIFFYVESKSSNSSFSSHTQT
jgi:hypothetical protein